MTFRLCLGRRCCDSDTGTPCLGPPSGTGKTLLAKAAATETRATFIELKIADVVRGEVGESEKVGGKSGRGLVVLAVDGKWRYKNGECDGGAHASMLE